MTGAEGELVFTPVPFQPRCELYLSVPPSPVHRPCDRRGVFLQDPWSTAC